MSSVWEGVDRLLDMAESESAVAAHGLQLLAIRRWRETGRPVPPMWLDDQRLMSVVTLSLPTVLRRIREAVPGPILLMKGPEVACRYPDPALRPYGDLDLHVRDAEGARRNLLEAGLSPVDALPDQDRHHHGRPLRLDRLPLMVELHRRPNWFPWLPPPPVEELIAAAIPSRVGVEGISTLSPEHHALVVAVHGWRHGPLLSVGHLLDLALLAEECDSDELLRTAERWRVRRIWETSLQAARSLLLGEGSSLPLLVGGRHLRRLRERSIIGRQASVYVGTLWSPSPIVTARAVTHLVSTTMRPVEAQSLTSRLARLARVARRSTRPFSTARSIDM